MPDLFNVSQNRKTYKNLKKQFAVYDSETSVTLKQGQGDQIRYELVNPKHGYDDAKFAKPCLNSVRERANNKKFLSNQETCQLSPLNTCESKKYWYIHDLLDVLNNPESFNLTGYEHEIFS